MAQFLDKQGLTTYSNLIKGELDALDARIEALETGGKYMPLSGGTFTGNVTMGAGTKLSGIATPVSDNDAVNKAYVDSSIANTGGTGKEIIEGEYLINTTLKWRLSGNSSYYVTDFTVNEKTNKLFCFNFSVNGTLTGKNVRFYGSGTLFRRNNVAETIILSLSESIAVSSGICLFMQVKYFSDNFSFYLPNIKNGKSMLINADASDVFVPTDFVLAIRSAVTAN